MIASAGCLLLTTAAVSAGDVLDQSYWHWRNPYPNGNNLRGAAYGAGTFVAVGTSGTIMTSTNGQVWESRESGVVVRFNQVIYAQGAFVAVGNGGAILSSTNGIDWVSHSTSPDYDLRGVVFAGGKYVIVGYYFIEATGSGGQLILTSDRLGQWSVRQYPSSKPLNQVTYGDGFFMAVGGAANTVPATILTSTNGLDWTDLSHEDIYSLTSVGFGSGVFVTVNNYGDTWTSSDRTNWLHQAIGGFPAMWGVSFVGNQFLVPGATTVGSARLILTSIDGTNWAGLDSTAADPLFAVTGGESGYVAVGQHGQIVSSSDGTTWTNQTSFLFSHLGWFSAVTFGNGRFVAVGQNIGASTDGVTWEMSNATVPALLTDVTFGGDRFLAAGLKGSILWSDDGLAWQSAQIAPEIQLTSCAYGSGVYLVAGISAGPSPVDSGWLLASTNLTDWETVYHATNKVPRRIVYGSGRFVVSASSQRLALVSSNGLDWTEVSTDPVGITDMVFADGQFVALEGRSTNGLDWTFNSAEDREFVSLNFLADIAFGDGVFVALDSWDVGEPGPAGGGVWVKSGGGSIWTSTNGVGWSKGFVSPFTIWDIAFGNGTFVAVGEHTMIVQSADISSLVPIRLSGSLTTNQLFRLTITSAAGLALAVEISSDLQTWQTLRTLVNESGQTNLLETIPPTTGQRFYRAKSLN
jgi:hypothetical protein